MSKETTDDVSGCVFIECHSAGRCRAPDFQITCKRVSNDRPSQSTAPKRPRGTNADEWHLFLCEYLDNRATTAGDGLAFIAVQIADAIEAERERCAMLHESVDPASDDERLNGVPGAGAMGAVIQYRDLIRGQRT